MEDGFKYPRTPHLLGSRLQVGDTTEGQVDLNSLPDGLNYVWEEKLDGANSGMRFNHDGDQMLHSRGHYLTGGFREKQFAPFKVWATRHMDALFDLQGNRYHFYGEWCYAKHTVYYDRLPHYFLEFDIYDRERKFCLSTKARHRLLAGSPVVSVPVVKIGREGLRTPKDIHALIGRSLYKSENWLDALRMSAERAGVNPEQAVRETDMSDKAEGLYLKVEDDEKVLARFKFVRPDFLQAILDSGTHWAARPIIPNRLADGVDIFA